MTRTVHSLASGCCALLLLEGIPAQASDLSLDPRFRVGEELVSDDFAEGLDRWAIELENGGVVEAKGGTLDIDVPAGCTVWFKKAVEGPVLIEYQATVISAGGSNDRVSDLNCFWMARDSRSEKDLFGYKRTGQFADYNPLRCYYIGLGGNGNTTTRFRRYIGDTKIRPLLPEHDLNQPADLIQPNVVQTIRLVACGRVIEFFRDNRRLFEMNDPEPYTSGWFGFRTVSNHMAIRRFRIHRLYPVTTNQPPRARP